ncbi:MAG: copper chaperone PCu(A)C [Candidatus Rokuibacteriota bacterium]
MTVRRPSRLGIGLAVLLLAGACTYFPSVRDTGGVRLRPERARAVRSSGASEAVVYFLLRSTGKYGDVLTGAKTEVARRAELRSSANRRVDEIEIPGETVVSFEEKGPRVVLTDLTRTLNPGEVIIVTLHFQKSGSLGLITVVE